MKKITTTFAALAIALGATGASVSVAPSNTTSQTKKVSARVYVTLEEIKDYVSQYSGIDADNIKNHDDFYTDLGMDSISVLSMFRDIEVYYDVMFTAYEYLSITTTAALYEYVLEY